MFPASPETPRSARSTSAAPRPIHSLPADDLPADTGFRRVRSRATPYLIAGLVVPGLVGTAAIPAYAHAFHTQSVEAAYVAAVEAYTEENAQTVVLDAVAAPVAAERDSYAGVSAAEMAAAELATRRAAYAGPSVADLLANPPYPSYDMNTIVSIAMEYQGVPYVYGGNTPAGFDCSGFTQFVFAHVGISLPHSSSVQGQLTAIAPEAALPGDLVILDGGGHVGIYVGGGRMIDAPRPGGVVSVRPMWGSYWFVRPGI